MPSKLRQKVDKQREYSKIDVELTHRGTRRLPVFLTVL